MSDPADITTLPPPEQDLTPPHPLPSEPKMESASQADHVKELTKSEKPLNTTFSIWPPTQRTREAVINRLIETLSTSSVLSKRYGIMSQDEASAAARVIEEEAYAAAGGAATSEDDGIEILQVYSKEISKRMLQAVKARAALGTSPENGLSQTENSPVPPATPSEEISSVDES